ncbi:hypothetical protein A1Q1_06938 [Trichosporon asahii var. asahii CBS 2479]|uniref:MPN domain-containing protein n=1 Tax=Trichosporon asahii var. asahii (strain ATCC 90039 / CBS 2479 / JCM 2466 / KCTC 7840 / NBRC 103889/ NCYC 2677 / UAMH 7654) TaxID=1186058 RepID=J4UJ61_TRIAS|nr:hypothetical protein A1Q1_06938 [Trichosporon asahii var. asahii CBS 2479]EJT51800.1 hypothetical protein A1Q1_06938 [Trichosporon asahii var. asahii CBS 2479]
MSVTLSASAYTLPLLHAARHPASTVLGLLLARGAEIVEALPILHRYASLSLTIDTALRFVRAHAKDNGLTIAGVYIANEDGSTKVPRVAERLLETIRKENPSAIGLVLDNSKLATSEPIYVSAAQVTFPSQAECEKAIQAVKKGGAHKSLVDFDDYMDDSNSDWPENMQAKKALA